MSDSKIDWSKGTLTQPANPENNNEAIDWNNGTLTHPDEIPVKKNKGIVGHLQDTAASLASGLASVPDMAVGVADMYTEGRAGKAIDDTGVYKMGEASKYWQDKKTDIAKEQDITRQSTEGIWNKTKYVLENPSQITNAVVESAPSILAGGVAGRISKIANPLVAGAVGEGIVGAGAQAENIRQQTNDGLLDNGQQAAAAGTGALTSLFSMAGGKLAQKMGIGDVDTLLTRGHATPAQVAGEIASMPAKSLPRKVIEGAISEGFLEELPQSVSEQIIQNLALDKPWHEGVEDAAVMGTLAGMAMGGGIAPFHGNPPTSPSGQDNSLPPENPNNPLAPLPAPAGNDLGSTPMEGEYIPRPNSQDPAQAGRTPETVDGTATEWFDRERLQNAPANTSPDLLTGIENQPEAFDAPANPALPAPSIEPAKPSEQLGLDPNAGSLSAAAALAVDSGASPHITNPDTAINQVDESAQAAGDLTKPRTTADDIKNGFNALAGGAVDAMVERTSDLLQAGQDVTFYKPDSIASALQNPNYHVQQNEDGSATVLGALDPRTNEWIGQAPAQPDTSQQITPADNGQDINTSRQRSNTNRTNEQVMDDALAAVQRTKDKLNDPSRYPELHTEQAINERKDYELPGGYVRSLADQLSSGEAVEANNSRRANIFLNNPNFNAAKNEDGVVAVLGIKHPDTGEWVGRAPEQTTTSNPAAAAQSPAAQEQSPQAPTLTSEYAPGSVPHARDIATQALEQYSGDTTGLTDKGQSLTSHSPAADLIYYKNSPSFSNVEVQDAGDKAVVQLTNAKTGAVETRDYPQSLVGFNQFLDGGQAETTPAQASSATTAQPTESNQVEQLEQQLADTKNVAQKAQLRKQINELKVQQGEQAAPVLGADGNNKWFGSQQKAQGFIDKNKLDDTHQVVQTEKNRFEIQPKQPATQNVQDAPQSVEPAVQQQNAEVPNPYKENQLRANVRNINTQVSSNAKDATTRPQAFNQEVQKQYPGLYARAEALAKTAKTTPAGRRGNTQFSSLSFDGDKTYQSGDPYPKKPTKDEVLQQAIWHLSQDDKNNESHAWDNLDEQQKTEVLKRAGWKTNAGGLNVIGKKLLKQNSTAVNTETMKIIERNMPGNQGVQQQSVKPASTDAKSMTEAEFDQAMNSEAGARSLVDKGISAGLFTQQDIDTVTNGNFAAGWTQLDQNDSLKSLFKSKGLIQGQAQQPAQQGTAKPKTVTTSSGKQIEVRFKVVEASELGTSHTGNGAINPAYPQELQPRDRSRSASINQINDIAANLNPHMLGDSPTVTDGAPIVSSDNIVESGNGRTLAITKAYQTGRGEAYRQHLRDAGYDVNGMQQPVLVRERVTPMTMQERIEYTGEANQRNTLGLSVSEQAEQDAKKLSSRVTSLYRGGDINSPTNTPFIKALMNEVVPQSEHGNMQQKDGQLSQDGRRRIQAALLQKAYGDSALVTEVFESTDTEIASIGKALLDVAGEWALMRDGVQNGELLQDVDVTANLMEAVRIVQKARAERRSIAEVARQDDIFSGTIDPVTEGWLSVFYRGDHFNRARSREKVSGALSYYVGQASLSTKGENLLGETAPGGREILGATNERTRKQEQDTQQDIFSSPRANESNPAESGRAGQGRTTEKQNEEAAKPEVGREKSDVQVMSENKGDIAEDIAREIQRVNRLKQSIRKQGKQTSLQADRSKVAKKWGLNPVGWGKFDIVFGAAVLADVAAGFDSNASFEQLKAAAIKKIDELVEAKAKEGVAVKAPDTHAGVSPASFKALQDLRLAPHPKTLEGLLEQYEQTRDAANQIAAEATDPAVSKAYRQQADMYEAEARIVRSELGTKKQEQTENSKPDLVEEIQSMSLDDISALFDEVAQENNAVETSKPKAKRSTKGKTATGKPRPKPKEAQAEKIDPENKEDTKRTASAIAKDIGANLSDAGLNALDGLAKLFGGNGKMNSGLSFDEDTYAKAKPHFVQSAKSTIEAGKNLKDLIRALINAFGDGIKPYVMRFASEVQNGEINLKDDDAVKQQDSTTESRRPKFGDEDYTLAHAKADLKELRDKAAGLRIGDADLDRRVKLFEDIVESMQEQGNDTTPQLGTDGKGTLEGVSTQDVSGLSEAGDTGPKGRGSSGTNVQGSGRTGTAGIPAPRGMGDGAGEVHHPAGEQGLIKANGGIKPEQAVVATNTPDSAFNITAEDNIGAGGKKTKYRNNVEAIRLLKQLEQEGRQATAAEQKVLAKFVGWGGLAEAFKRDNGAVTKGWEKEVAELEQLLAADEMKAAVDSSNAAHYTSPEIVTALWDAIKQFGFVQGRVLEPSVGVGNFFGLMPKGMRSKSALHAVELDTITGGIAKQLYPAANIKAPMGFQDYQTIDGYFDVAIGNPPFGRLQITDAVRREISGMSIHNYFFAKSIDSLKPNGVLAMVVTNRMLDTPNDKARQYMAERTEFLGAIRLPNDAFLANAGTQVTTDLIFLRRLGEDEQPTGHSWTQVKDYRDKNGNVVPLNEYFVKNPQNMLGDFGMYGSMYSAEDSALVKRDGQDTNALLKEAIGNLPKDVFRAEPSKAEETNAALTRDISEVKVGAMFVDGDRIMERTPDVMGEQQAAPVELANNKAVERVTGMIGVQQALADVRTLQLSHTATEAQIEKARKALNQSYDAFVKENGFINSDANKRLMRDDPNWPQLSALEDRYDAGVSVAVSKRTGEPTRKPSAHKAAIFSTRTQSPVTVVTKVNSAKDALVESMNRHGAVQMDTMTKLYGKSEQEIISELGDLVFNDPEHGLVTKDAYLSGNVKKKLAQAKEEASKDPAFERNVVALERVIPADIEAIDIEVRPGAHWIPASDVADFINHVLSTTGSKANYSGYDSAWSVAAGMPSASANAQYSTERVKASAIVAHALNGSKPVVRDKVDEHTTVINQEETAHAGKKVDDVKRAWKDWIWESDERRTRLSRLYNDTFNTDVTRTYDGSHLKLEGKVDDSVIRLRPHQLNAAWRIIQNPSTLADHTVGAGKTFTLIAATMELRRMGIAKKPMLVVPNHLVGQWAADFTKLYPNANILAATKRDFEKGNRKRFFARIANGDYDAVIVAHSSFGRLAVDPNAESTFIQNEIDKLMAFEAEAREGEGKDSRNAKKIADRRLALQEKQKKLSAEQNKDTDNIYWHELGVDTIMVDEAHEFKNLYFASKMQNVAGLGNGKGSQKASDLYMKTNMLQKNNPNAKVVFATGTPISNTMAEMFTMQRYLDGQRLAEQGVEHFDAWAKMFGEVVSDWELSPSGKYKLTNRFAKFSNMPELMQRYLSFADVINRDDINRQLAERGETLGTPKIKTGKPINTVVERSDVQAEYIGVPSVDEHGVEHYPEGSLVHRSENLPTKPEKGADNMLKIMSDARKAALDMRLIDPAAADYEGSKVNVAADNIMADYHKWADKKGTQLVFCDLSTPKGAVAKERARIDDLMQRADQGDEDAQTELDKISPDDLEALTSSFSVYDDLKAKLIAKGIPENEIAFIHDANTDLQKQELFGKVRSGQIRVLIGSTSKMGAGMNVQDRLVALHHLDAPWRPSDLEQREGRIIRQGNMHYKADPDGFEVGIYRYATKQTLDSRMWQTLETKARFIEQIRKGDSKARVVEDVGSEAANAAEMKAASSGDPRILREMELKKQLRDMQEEHDSFRRDKFRAADMLKRLNQDIETLPELIANIEQDLQIKQPEKYRYQSASGQVIQQGDEKAREVIGNKLASLAHKVAGDKKAASAGEINGFAIEIKPVENQSNIVEFELTGKSGEPYSTTFSLEQDSTDYLVQRLTNLVKKLPDTLRQAKSSLDYAKTEAPKLQKKAEAKWDRQAEMGRLQQEHEALIDELKPKKKDDSNDAGKPLHSRQQEQQRTNTTTKQVRDKLVEKFGEDVIQSLEQQGLLEIVDTHSEAGVEGFYHNGKVTLVADGLTADTIIPTFLHELGGHGGMQGLMKPSTYNELMRGFEAMVKSGNPLALEAKRRAEVETDPAVQQQEYLPYLISVASEAQAAGEKSGALQAIQRFIQRVISAIKAWAVDKLGVPLNLNPDDVVALAERMVQRVARDKSQSANATLPHSPGQSKTGHGGVVGNRTSEQNTLKPEDIVKKMGDKPLFSRRAPGAFAQGIKAATVQNIKDQTSYKFKDWLGVGLQVLGRRQLVDIYHKLLPQLTQYNNLAAQMDADKNDAGAKADELAQRWAKVKDHEALANLMHDATLSGFDPALPYSQGDRFKYQQLRRAYDALTPEAKALYADVRDAYTDHQKAVMYAIKQRIMRSELSNQKKAELLKNMDSNFFHKRKGVYFPLARFGKYVVVVRNNAGVVESVSRAETMGEAQAMRKELLDQFPQNQGFAISEVSKDKAFVASRDMVGRGFMTELYAELDKQNIPASQKAELEDTLGQLYLSSLPDLSWAKHGIHRKGTAGFSQDARRAFAQHMFHGASYLAKLRYADLLASELDAMQKYSDQQKNNPDFDQPTAQSVIDEMNVRHESLMNPKGHPLSSALTSLGFIYHLGLSPASAIVNLLQTPLVAYPILGAKWGFDKAATALTRASAEAMKHKNELDKGLQGDELRAYKEAVRRGVIDVTQAHDLAGIAQGEDSAVMWKMRPVMRWASVLFHHAERFNRGATFLAAYRLARAANTNHADAFDQAVEATYAGHFDYSAGNRARIMQGNTAKVILLFKQFSQNMIYTMARNAQQAIMATDPAKQKEARRIIRGMLITHSLAAGIYGLPMVTVLLAAASMLGSDDDEPWDAETAFRNYLADTFGATAANVMTRGVSRATPFDISGRVGLDHMIFPDTQEGLEGQRWAESFASGALGPVAGIGMNLAKGASQIADGDWAHGLESMAPAALRGPLKALRYEQEGAIDKSGVSILDEVSLPSIVGQAAGFSPSSVRTATEGKSAILSMERKVASRRSDLLNDFSQAAIKGDTEKMNEIRAEIATFNQAQPTHRIQANHLMQSVRQKRKRINQAEHGVYLPRGKRELLDEGRFAFDQ
ncbi:PLxRFG domain-containing protein [Alkanindiges illinoisensis]|uniref:PLxRFG domain-containing protein n=1 Tax=Alkanindiges illinoisensis TaxID=197183 RepID=UPI00141A22AB|nr:PLxRFG domain-containing protein [Alkanindiges illinoisensis]